MKNNICVKILIIFTVMLNGMTAAADLPVADFFAVPTSGWDVYYKPEFISVSTGEISSYLWDFGDDSTSTELAPNHKYAHPGIYTVTLTVSGPGGLDTLKREDYITVKDFSKYPYPTYIIQESTITVWDSLLDAIQASQLEGPNPNDLAWWGSSYVDRIKHGGGGRILFGFSNDTIYVDHHRDFFGDNLIIDGQDKNIHFYYNGPDPCTQTEGQDALIRIHGNDNIFRNVNFDRFPEGIHLRGGQRNLIENVTVNIICEDAITMNGGGNKVIDCIIKDCSFDYSEDKTIMVNSGISIGAMVISGCYSYNGTQPIRMTGTGLLVVRNCEFTGSINNGPRFGGKTNLVIFENNYSHGTKSGLRLSDGVSAIIRNNMIKNCTQYGIRTQNTDDVVARVENNIITGNTNGVYFLDNKVQMDLGGGFLNIHRHSLLSGPGSMTVPSVGSNTLKGNFPYDLINQTSNTVKAEHNFWDHTTVEEVLANDVSGIVDVDPLGEGELTGFNENLLEEVPEEFLLFQNYPNPFNATTTVRYWLPEQTHLKIEIFNIQGQSVRVLINQKQPEGLGQINWDGRGESDVPLSSGIYYIRLISFQGRIKNQPSSIATKALLMK